MAKKVKITKGGQTVYPATVMDAVVHPDLRVDSSKLIEEVNVSKIYPMGGIDGTNKYTLEAAIAKIPSSLRNVGLKCSFLNEAGQIETWKYRGRTWAVEKFTQVGTGKFTEMESSVTKVLQNAKENITILNAEKHESVTNDMPIYKWLQGGMTSAGIELTSGTTYENYIKTEQYFRAIGNSIKLSCASGFGYRVFVYSSEKVFESYQTFDRGGDNTFTTDTNKNYRFNLLKYPGGQTITPIESANAFFKVEGIVGESEEYSSIKNIVFTGLASESDVMKLLKNSITEDSFEIQDIEWEDGTYYTSDGTKSNMASWESCALDVSLLNGRYALYNGYSESGGYCGFLGDENKIISSYQTVNNVLFLKIPNDAKVLFCSNRKENYSDKKLSISVSNYQLINNKGINITIQKITNALPTGLVMTWLQGGMTSAGIEITSGTTYENRIKTEQYFRAIGNSIKLSCASGFGYRVFVYSSEKVFESYQTFDRGGDNTFTTDTNKNYRFNLLKYPDGQTITPIESENAFFKVEGIVGESENYEYLPVASKEYVDTKIGEVSKSIKNNLKGKRVAFLGDSITQGLSASSQENTYHGVFCSLYEAVDRTAEIYNERGSSSTNLLGMNGTCIANNAKGAVPYHFITRATAENFADSKLIVVFGGTNDFSYDSKPIGDLFIEEIIEADGNIGTKKIVAPTDTDTFAGALHELINHIQSVCPKVPIVFMTPLHRNNNNAPKNPNSFQCNSNGDFMIDYVDAIKKICAFYAIPVLDLYSNAQLNPLSPAWESMFVDGLHPNNEGHKIIGNLLYRFVEQNVVIM